MAIDVVTPVSTGPPQAFTLYLSFQVHHDTRTRFRVGFKGTRKVDMAGKLYGRYLAGFCRLVLFCGQKGRHFLF